MHQPNSALLAALLPASLLIGLAAAADDPAKKGDSKAPTTAPSVSLSKAEFRLEVGLDQKTFTALLQGRNLDESLRDAPLAAADRGLPAQSKTQVAVATPVELASGPASRDWWLPITVASLPRNTSESRILHVTLGSLTRDLEYVVTNQPSSDFKWSVQPPPNPWVIFGDEGRRIKIPISTGPQAVTDVRVSHNLVEERTKRPLPPDALVLCDALEGECAKVRGDANSPVEAYLKYRAGILPGKYTGSLFIGTPEKTAPESLAVSLQMSSTGYAVLGVLALLAGVSMGWIISAWTSARLERVTALDMVARVQRALLALQERWKPEAGAGSAIYVRLGELAASLQESVLDRERLLPPKTPQFFARSSAAALQSRLDGASQRLSVATLVFQRGWLAIIGDPPTPAREDALAKLERLAIDGESPELAAPAIVEILNAYRAVKADRIRALGVSESESGVEHIVPISEEKVERAFAGLNALGWLFWGVLTIVGGWYAFLLDKPGFGLPVDYVMCFFWGIGLPTAADKLSPAGVMQTLRASTPKAA